MEFKGTKGKWVLSYNDICSQKKLISTAFGFIVRDKYTINKETKANALLISKSPEMLEMLKDVKDYLGSDKREQVEQLIKEATEI